MSEKYTQIAGCYAQNMKGGASVRREVYVTAPTLEELAKLLNEAQFNASRACWYPMDVCEYQAGALSSQRHVKPCCECGVFHLKDECDNCQELEALGKARYESEMKGIENELQDAD